MKSVERERQVGDKKKELNKILSERFYLGLATNTPFHSALRLLKDKPTEHKAFRLIALPPIELQQEQENYYRETFNSELPKIETAIKTRDLLGLRIILGSPTYLHLLKKSKEIRLKWLEAKLELELIQFRGVSLVNYLREIGFPRQLNRKQENNLKDHLQNVYETLLYSIQNTIQAGIKIWDFNNETLETNALAQLKDRISQESGSIPGCSWGNIMEFLYAQNLRVKELQDLCLSYEEEQHERINSTPRLLGVISDNPPLASPLAQFGLSSSLLNESKAHKIFVLAIEQYNQTENDADKIKSLLIIEDLLANGAKPPVDFTKKLAWPVLSLILKRMVAPTEFTEAVQKRLFDYSSKSQKDMENWYHRWFIDTGIRENRRVDVQNFVMVLYSNPGSLDKLDTVLADVIFDKEKTAVDKSWGKNSSLYRSLNEAIKEKNKGGELSRNGEFEMKEQKYSPSREQFAPRRYSLLGDNLNPAPVTDSNPRPKVEEVVADKSLGLQ